MSNGQNYFGVHMEMYYLVKKILRLQKQITKLKEVREMQRLQIENCSCQIFPTHVFKDDDFICTKVLIVNIQKYIMFLFSVIYLILEINSVLFNPISYIDILFYFNLKYI